MPPNEGQIIDYRIPNSAELHFTVFPQKQNTIVGATYHLSPATSGAVGKTVTPL